MGTPLRVLILEDNASDRELTQYALKQAGFDPSCSTAETESEFVAALHPDLDLVIADYQLPQFDGARALQCVQAAGIDVPFIIVSGALGEERAVELMRAGATDYLVKDRLARLGEAVRRALAQKRDRDERARAVRALQELAARMEQQQRWLEMVLDLLPLPVIMVDSGSGRTQFSNKAAEAMYGAPIPKDVPALDIFRFSRADGSELPAGDMPAARAARGERLDGMEALWRTAAGTYHLSFYSEVLPGAQGRGDVIVLVFQDISSLKRTEGSLRETISQLQRERELREIFVSTLSHDLRTPLVAARMSAELLARQETDATTSAKLRGRVLENIDRLDGMIQTLLDANLIRAGHRLPLTLGRCSFVDTIRDVVEELTTVHGDRFDVDTPDRCEGYWDGRFLRRIVENLVTNALKYGDDGAPITIRLAPAGECVQFSVHNEGNPIRDQAGMFEPFRRASVGASGKRGWGVGLTLVRGAAEAHGGRVEFDSAEDRGTTFTVTLPRDARSAAAEAGRGP